MGVPTCGRDEIAIPEIQRPFFCDSSKVRDLMDSLYKGFPVGYVIAWRNPNVRLKDDSLSEGKKILIDGQQRVTALKAAILGDYVVDKNYQQIKIKIAFHPIEERFEVLNPAILKDKNWLPDISLYFGGETAGAHASNRRSPRWFLASSRSAFSNSILFLAQFLSHQSHWISSRMAYFKWALFKSFFVTLTSHSLPKTSDLLTTHLTSLVPS